MSFLADEQGLLIHAECPRAADRCVKRHDSRVTIGCFTAEDALSRKQRSILSAISSRIDHRFLAEEILPLTKQTSRISLRALDWSALPASPPPLPPSIPNTLHPLPVPCSSHIGLSQTTARSTTRRS